MNEPSEKRSLVYLAGENPRMIWLDEDQGYQCSVPADWLKEWLDLPAGESDSREGKAWWYSSPDDQEATSYRVENRQGVLCIEVEVASECACLRKAVLPIDELRRLVCIAAADGVSTRQ